jgi:Ca2+-binding RTX toxin-like protein
MTVFRSNDTIIKGAGNDTINPGLGFDYVHGGDGFDHLILDYSVGDTGTGMTFRENGQSGFASRSANGINLDYINFYNIEQFTVTGTSKDDIFDLFTPNSTIRAGAGNDQVTVGGPYWLPIAGNVGKLDGGAGFDFLKLNLANQTANLTLNLRDINISGVVSATNFEQFALKTGSGNDTVLQTGIVNGAVLRANDSIQTNAGNDTINAGLGLDSVYGGDGLDHLILDYSVGDTGTGMTFAGGSQFGSAERKVSSTNSTRLDSIYFDYIEQFTVTGTSKDDILDLYTPNSTIRAGAGNDQVRVGGSNWLLIAGNVGKLDGGAGFDFLKLNLANQTANLTLTNLLDINISGVVRATNFERFELTTGSGNDTVLQTGIVNGAVLRANDTITTGAGNDTINAGLGFDSVYGGYLGLDHLILDYSVGDTGTGMTFQGSTLYGTASRNVSSPNSALLDFVEFSGIERFTVTGTSKNDTISGASGNDIINAGAGNDILTGQAGGDILTGGNGNDTFKYEDRSYSLLSNYDVIKDFVIGSDIIDGTNAVAAAQVKKLGSVSALTETAIKQVLTATNFSQFGASTFQFNNRTFLGLNDGTAGFSASTDAIIEITGFTGNLANLAIA